MTVSRSPEPLSPRARVARWVIRILVLMSIPAVSIAATQLPAEAQVKYSDGETLTYEQTSDFPGWGFDCHWPVFTQWMSQGEELGEGTEVTAEDGETFPVLQNGHCDLGPAVSNNHTLEVTFQGSSELGDCSASLTTGSIDIGGTYSASGQHFGNALGQNTPDCDVNEICWTLTKTGGSVRDSRCEGVEMESPMPTETTPTTCEYSGATIEAERPTGPHGIYENGQATQYTFQATTSTGVPLGASGWFIYYVLKRTSGTAGYAWLSEGAMPNSLEPDVFFVKPADHGGFTGFPYLATQRISNLAGTTWAVVGAGYQFLTKTGTVPQEGKVTALPQNQSNGQLGVTDPSRCLWYWGEKIASTVADDFDEPIDPFGGPAGDPGGTDDPPEGEEDPDPGSNDGCNFSMTDPESWVSAGICALVGIMRAVLGLLDDILGVLASILGAIGGLVGALMSALGTLLQTLFIPSDDFLGGLFDGVSKETGNYGGWAEAVTGITDAGSGGGEGFAAAQGAGGGEGFQTSEAGGTVFGGLVDPGSGCTGPVIHWDALGDIPGPVGGFADGQVAPLEACEGNSAQLASLCHLLLTILIGVMGAMKCLDMLTTQTGIAKQGYTMINFDWSSTSKDNGRIR